jgi:twitching motility protein PilT
MELTLDSFLQQARQLEASDLHLQVGATPRARVFGQLVELEGRYALNAETMKAVLAPLLTEPNLSNYKQRKSLDTSYQLSSGGRFRASLFIQQGQLGAVFRHIPDRVPTLEELRAPAILKEFAAAPRGLVIVTGQTGSGKSTTLAATIEAINRTRRHHILTIEEPIEFVYQPQLSMINQREVPNDVPSFIQGLEDGLRADPDVIMLGELRDLETMRAALTAAETGHLVLATLHTSSASSSIDRLVDVFPAEEQNQIRTMIANSLNGIISQTLLPRIDGQGRAAAFEILVADNAVRAHIRRGQSESIRNELVTKANIGMQTLDTSLAYLVHSQQVAEEVARSKAQLPKEFEARITAFRTGNKAPPVNLLSPEQEVISIDEQ